MKLTSQEGKTLSPAIVKEAIQTLGSTDERLRSRAYAALSLPLREKVEVESSVRRIYSVVPLGAQEDAIFPVDTNDNVEVVLSSAYGVPPISMFVTDLVTVNTDTYQGGWEVPEQLVASGRIDQVARNQRRMVDGFIVKEETTGWGVIDACRSAGNTVEVTGSVGTDSASIELINLMVTYFQDAGYVPDICFMSPGCMGDFRLLCKEAGLPNEVRFDVWRGGMIPGLWGVDFYALRSLSDDYLYMFDSSRFGVMPIRQEVETREDPMARSQFKVRVYGQEQVGFAAIQKDAACFGTTGKA